MHKERCERPVKGSAGKFMNMAATNHLGRNIYCINKNFFLRRHPYFWRGMLVVKDATKHRLSSAHKLFLNPSRPNPGRREKYNLNFYFHNSLWCLKRFYEDLKGLHKTFLGTTKAFTKRF